MNPGIQLRAVQFQRRRDLGLLAVAVAAHPRRFAALHEVRALRVLILVDDAILQRQIVVRQPGGASVRLRIEFEELRRDRIHAARGDHVPRERRARSRRADDRALRWIDDDPGWLPRLRVDSTEARQQRGEVAAPHRRGRHAVETLELFAIVVALEIRHEEQMVLPDGAAGRVAVLIPLERRFGGGGLRGREGVRSGIERVVADKFEERAVQVVRPRLGDHVHLARLAPEFGGVDAGLHFEFFERVHRRQKDIRVEVDVGVVHAVQRVVVEFPALP